MNRFNHTSRVANVTSTDSPKSIRNRCIIKVFVTFLCSHGAFWNFVDVGVFAIGVIRISSFSP